MVIANETSFFCAVIDEILAESFTLMYPSAGLMLAHRRRRWANIKPALNNYRVINTTLMTSQRSDTDTSIFKWDNSNNNNSNKYSSSARVLFQHSLMC